MIPEIKEISGCLDGIWLLIYAYMHFMLHICVNCQTD
jgi:hypothetical protein